ncbi:Solute carrier family 25 member 35 [Armadillidium vulgare]|nr:Solute carrier family 25 member 35 [Armadillidium vulgare]
MEFVVGATAACGAVIISNPFDVLKTRMQLQGELKARGQYVIVYRNIFHAFYAVTKVDGILALQKGLMPAMSYQVVLNGTRFGLYQTIIDSGIISYERWKRINIGMHFGWCICWYSRRFSWQSTFFGTQVLPIKPSVFQIKTQLQARAHESIAVGYQHHHKDNEIHFTTIKGAFIALKSIYNKNGIRGLWRGSSTAVPRAGVGSASQLFVYSKSKDCFILVTVGRALWLARLLVDSFLLLVCHHLMSFQRECIIKYIDSKKAV